MNNLSNYKAVILAGGKGTRLYPITKEIPKPLLPVKKRPIINYLVDLFYSQGIKDVAVLINKEFSQDFHWWKKRYYPKKEIKFFEEDEPLGTFGGLWLLKDWIGERPFFLTNGDELKEINLLKNWIGERPFFLTNGDELKEINLLKMIEIHQKTNSLATIALVKVPDPSNYGVVICQNGYIKEFLEKPKNPPSNYISSGLYLLSPEIFQYHSGPKFLMIEKDIFPKLAKEKKLAGFKFNGKWMDTGTWERYEKAIEGWA